MNKPLTSLQTVYPAEIAKKGTQVYQKISKQIEKNQETFSGKNFLLNAQNIILQKV